MTGLTGLAGLRGVREIVPFILSSAFSAASPCTRKKRWKTRAPRGNVSRMSTLTVTLDDETARLVEKAAQVVNQPVEDWLRESICQAAAEVVNTGKTASCRISPLHPGAMQLAPNFDAPLEESAPFV